ncbi:MAG TPA: bifunctional DedA family/phosphatase PAP2 family protein [Methylomirabilota bacterium]|nr:bifunctional DedA family/phosphatase PAP2 family protein [Methylomirabilota bacterium]
MLEGLLQHLTEFMATHRALALLLLFAFSAGEALFVVGLFVPGMVVLVGAGALVGAGRLPFFPVFAAAAAGAFVGDLLSYWIGRKYRGEVRRIHPFPRYAEMLGYGEAFIRRYGAVGVLLSHFVPGVKAVVPALAGVLGMGAWRFTAVTAITAPIWAAVVLVPSVGVGMGMSRVGAANPRLLALFVALVLLLWIAYRIVRLVTETVWPVILARIQRIADAATARAVPGARILDAVVYNREGIVAPIVWVGAAGFAVMGFVDLTFGLTTGSSLAASDQALSNLVQGFRTPPGDVAMVAITMVGDGVVLASVAAAVMAALLIHREWPLAGAAAAAMAATALFVPFTKALLERTRPTTLYSGADAFSFPSGHASLSMTVMGVVAVLLAHRLDRRSRLTVYAIAAAAAVLVAFSRIYLAAHWPSDVAAGLLFGGAMVSAFALALHNRTLAIHTAPLAAAIVAAFAVSYSFNVQAGHAAWMQRYAVVLQPQTMARAEWLGAGGRALPRRRIELSGETGERTDLQTDADPAVLAAALSSAGWRVETDPGLGILAVLPATEEIDRRPPLPLFHDGRQPVLSATREAGDGTRTVLRFWPSGYATEDGAPILLGSLTSERLRQLALGYAVIDDDDTTGAAERVAAVAALAEADGVAAVVPDGEGRAILVTRSAANPGGH